MVICFFFASLYSPACCLIPSSVLTGYLKNTYTDKLLAVGYISNVAESTGDDGFYAVSKQFWLVWLYFETFTRFIEFSSDLVSGETGAIRRLVISSTRLLKNNSAAWPLKHILCGSMQTASKPG